MRKPKPGNHRKPKPQDIAGIFGDSTRIEEAVREGVRNALRQHKRAGNPVAAWRDGKVVWVKPEDIPDF